MKLLILDDYVDILNILSMFMALPHHGADKALNCLEAVELLTNNFY
jgi:hypothetical protein